LVGLCVSLRERERDMQREKVRKTLAL
jgi:hypothetical protein